MKTEEQSTMQVNSDFMDKKPRLLESLAKLSNILDKIEASGTILAVLLRNFLYTPI